MNLNYITNMDNILGILAAQYVSCSTEKEYFYEESPKLKENEVCIEINKISKHNNNLLLEYENKVYYLTTGFNLESKNYNLIFKSKEELEKFNLLKDLYYEIKDVDVKCSVQKKYDFKEKEVKANVLKVPFISQYETRKTQINNGLKGFLCGFCFNNGSLKDSVVNDYRLGYKEFYKLENIIKSLKSQNLWNKTLSKSLNSSKTHMYKEVKKQLIKFDKRELIIFSDQRKQIKVNKNVLDMNEFEVSLYELFINNTLQNIELIGTKQLVRTNINIIYEYILKNTVNKSYIEDITQLYNRANEIDFDMNIDKIHSDVLKNLFVTYVKFENLKEFQLFLEEKNIQKSFLAYGMYGLCKGYSNIPRFWLLESMRDLILGNVFMGGIENIERILGDNNYNMKYTRDILNYYFNKIAFLLDDMKEQNIDIKFCQITIEKKRNNYYLYINNNELGEIRIEYYPRSAETLKRFDKKIKDLKQRYHNLVCNQKYYFKYSVKSGSLKKMPKIVQEYYYSILIKDIYKTMESVISYGK